MPCQPLVEAFFDAATGTVSYVIYDQPGGHAAIIDPVLDYDPKSGRTAARNAERLVAFVQSQKLQVAWILETHAHADHVSAAPMLKRALGGKIAIGAKISNVQAIFAKLFNLEDSFVADGRQFDHLFEPDESFAIGTLTGRALFVPGHTPADMAYQIGDAIFVGDTLFMPDVGSARCDFPGGDARLLYQSVQTLLSFPDDTRLFMCHDYPPAGRSASWQTTVAAQRSSNIHLHQGISEAAFVAMRQARDQTLDVPQLILPAIQINIRAGQLPPAESNGQRYLKIPLDLI